MRIELRVRTAFLILLLVLLVTTGSSVLAATMSGDAEPYALEEEVVALEDGSELWPYTSRTTTFEERTLSINLIIYGDARLAEFILRADPQREWREVDEEREDIAPAEEIEDHMNESVIGLGQAAGADRWIWLETKEEGGMWLPESYQLEKGDYLGERDHLRAYVDPQEGSWTAIQAHKEHWDWFHLRHTVHSVEDSQLSVEKEFIDRGFVEHLQRSRFGNDRSADADGWVTIVILDDEFMTIITGFLVFLVGGVGARVGSLDLATRLREEPGLGIGIRALGAVISIVVTYHAVRFGAIGLERQFPGLDPKLMVRSFYPFLVVGLPVVAYLSTRKLDATLAFSAATIGFVVAIFIDYSYLGVVRIPLETFVHRGSLAVAIGMIAAGASETARGSSERRGFVRTGVLLWMVAVAIPVVQFL